MSVVAGGPADFDWSALVALVEAEVNAEVVLREVAASAANLVDLDEGFGVGERLRGDADIREPMPVRLDFVPTVRILIQLRPVAVSRNGEVEEGC